MSHTLSFLGRVSSGALPLGHGLSEGLVLPAREAPSLQRRVCWCKKFRVCPESKEEPEKDFSAGAIKSDMMC